MNRKEYLAKLSKLLQDLPEEEREEALDYYENYFDEAGPLREQEVIRELGSPETVAAMIRDSVRGNEGEGEYREDGYHNEKYEDSNPMMKKKRKGEGWHLKGDRNRNLILLVFILILAGGWLIPAALSLIFGVGGGILGLTGGVIGFFLAFGGGCIALLVAGTGTLVTGIIKLFYSLPQGLMWTGGGCLMIAVGLLLVMLWVWLIASILPRLIRWFIQIFRRIFGKGGDKI